MADDGAKRKAMKTIAAFPGIDSISVDMKEKKLTIIGTVDPTKVVSRLRRFWTTELVTVGPAKEPQKEEGKKDDGKKDEGGSKPADEAKKESADQEKNPAKKEGEEGGQVKNEGEAATAAAATNVEAAASGGGDKKEEEKKVDPVLEMVRAYRAYNPHMTKHYYVQSMEENPNACVIC